MPALPRRRSIAVQRPMVPRVRCSSILALLWVTAALAKETGPHVGVFEMAPAASAL
eukprot:COSAG01_NODE_61150_length_291_cov_0.479167_1_plen_55_part_10